MPKVQPPELKGFMDKKLNSKPFLSRTLPLLWFRLCGNRPPGATWGFACVMTAVGAASASCNSERPGHHWQRDFCSSGRFGVLKVLAGAQEPTFGSSKPNISCKSSGGACAIAAQLRPNSN